MHCVTDVICVWMGDYVMLPVAGYKRSEPATGVRSTVSERM